MDQQVKPTLTTLLDSHIDLRRVEEVILSKIRSEAPRLEEICSYLHLLGGKRIRPALTLLMAQVFGVDKPHQDLIDVAAGIELIHMATLLHDDIIDRSPIRRREASPYRKFGINDTLLAGDFLLVRAFSLCAHLDSFVVEQTEAACVELTEGEILEVPLSAQPHNRESSLLIAKRKTGSLFRLACTCGAYLSEAPQELVRISSEFGESVGIAFQILDDILDVIGTAEKLGKPIGIDLIERKPSIVNVLWLEQNSIASQRLLLPTEDEASETAFKEQALQEIKESTVIEEARALAESYSKRAFSLLNEIEQHSRTDKDALKLLESLLSLSLQRLQ